MPRYYKVRVFDIVEEINDCFLIADDEDGARALVHHNAGEIDELKNREVDVRYRRVLEVEDQGDAGDDTFVCEGCAHVFDIEDSVKPDGKKGPMLCETCAEKEGVL